jgi:hypothetical protein
MGRVEVYLDRNFSHQPSGFRCEAVTSLQGVLKKLGTLYSPVKSVFFIVFLEHN